MSGDEVKKADQARDQRIRDQQKEPVRHRPKETEFDKQFERQLKLRPEMTKPEILSKVATEDAIREAIKHEDQRGGQQKKDEEKEDRREDRDHSQKGERTESKTTDHARVVAKGRTKREGGSFSGGHHEGGYGAGAGRRGIAKTLSKASPKSVPVDLQGAFASKLAKSLKAAAAQTPELTQQVINKIIQYVRIGLNRKGEKEIQMELSEKIFRGLKLRVIARGGKVAVHFSTSDPKGKKVFEKNRGAIEDALKKKGIDVDEIVIN